MPVFSMVRTCLASGRIYALVASSLRSNVADIRNLRANGNIYSRMSNPTVVCTAGPSLSPHLTHALVRTSSNVAWLLWRVASGRSRRLAAMRHSSWRSPPSPVLETTLFHREFFLVLVGVMFTGVTDPTFMAEYVDSMHYDV